MRQMWEIKQSTAPGILELYIYGDVEQYHLNLQTWEIEESETSAKKFRDELALHPDVREIAVYVNSYGGSVFEGTAIYNQLRRHPAHKTVYVDGFACSIASVIAMAGDTIVMPRNALMMIHNMWISATGNAAELRKVADDLDIINAAGMQAYLAKSRGKISAEQLAAMMDQETWLTAEQCIQYGFADQYAAQDADMGNAKEILQKANLSVQQRIDLQRELAAQLRQLVQDGPPCDPPKPSIMQILADSVCGKNKEENYEKQ